MGRPSWGQILRENTESSVTPVMGRVFHHPPNVNPREHTKLLIAIALGEEVGQRIATRGCSKCGGTQYRTEEVDANGNMTNAALWICGACGHMGD